MQPCIHQHASAFQNILLNVCEFVFYLLFLCVCNGIFLHDFFLLCLTVHFNKNVAIFKSLSSFEFKDTPNNWVPTHRWMSGRQSRRSHPALPFPRETNKKKTEAEVQSSKSDELKPFKRTTKSSKNHQRVCRKHTLCNHCQGAEEERPESCFTSRDSTVTTEQAGSKPRHKRSNTKF